MDPRFMFKRFSLRQWLTKTRAQRPRRLRLVESLPMGERRFVAVVSIDGHEFLVGATSHSMALLGELGCDPTQGYRDRTQLPSQEVQ